MDISQDKSRERAEKINRNRPPLSASQFTDPTTSLTSMRDGLAKTLKDVRRATVDDDAKSLVASLIALGDGLVAELDVAIEQSRDMRSIVDASVRRVGEARAKLFDLRETRAKGTDDPKTALKQRDAVDVQEALVIKLELEHKELVGGRGYADLERRARGFADAKARAESATAALHAAFRGTGGASLADAARQGEQTKDATEIAFMAIAESRTLASHEARQYKAPDGTKHVTKSHEELERLFRARRMAALRALEAPR